MMDLEAIKAREQRATAGPWLHKNWRVCAGVGTPQLSVVVDTAHNKATRTQQNLDNGEFIASAREDIPVLIAEVERLLSVIEECNGYCWSKTHDPEMVRRVEESVDNEFDKLVDSLKAEIERLREENLLLRME